jgi:hypothetical protein
MSELYLPNITDHQRLDRGHWMLQDCVLWLPMCDGGGSTCFDWSGRGNNGSLANMDPATDWVTGFRGCYALDFDGTTNDEVAIGSSPVTGTPATLSCWLKQDTSHVGGLFSVGGNPSNVRKEMGLVVNSSSVWALSQNNAGAPQFAYASASISSNQWYHAVAVFESATSRKLYLDGELKATNTTSITVSSLSRTKIGQRANGVDLQQFDGRISDARIWNRALTDSEVQRPCCDGGDGHGDHGHGGGEWCYGIGFCRDQHFSDYGEQ